MSQKPQEKDERVGGDQQRLSVKFGLTGVKL